MNASVRRQGRSKHAVLQIDCFISSSHTLFVFFKLSIFRLLDDVFQDTTPQNVTLEGIFQIMDVGELQVIVRLFLEICTFPVSKEEQLQKCRQIGKQKSKDFTFEKMNK